MRQHIIKEAANVRPDVTTVEALTYVSGRLLRQLQGCQMDKDWPDVFRKELTKLEGVCPENLDLLVQYHSVLRKTGQGWTYARSVKEMAVTDPYHPKILSSLGSPMSSTTQLLCERLDAFDPPAGHLDASLAATVGSDVEDFKQIGILQFFAQTDHSNEPLKGPTSQETIPLFVDWDKPSYNFRPQTESDRLSNEEEFHGTIHEEVFIRTDNMWKLFAMRADDVRRMCFAQFLCDYRRVTRSTLEYNRLLEALRRENSYLGPRCEKTMIAGTLETAPKFMMTKNDGIVRLRDSRQKILRLVMDHQSLSVKTKIILFGQWNRLEEALQDPDEDAIRQCDAVRLLLFPASTYTDMD